MIIDIGLDREKVANIFRVLDLHNMQPNGRSHALTQHLTSSVNQKAVSEEQQQRYLSHNLEVKKEYLY